MAVAAFVVLMGWVGGELWPPEGAALAEHVREGGGRDAGSYPSPHLRVAARRSAASTASCATASSRYVGAIRLRAT